MDETAGSPWRAVTPLRGAGDPPDGCGISGSAGDRFPLVRRFRELVGKDRASLAAWPSWRLRAEIGEFLHMSGRLGLSDTGLGVVLEAFSRAHDMRTYPSQHRTGTEVERRAFVALDVVATVVGERRTWPLDALTPDDQGASRDRRADPRRSR